ncbi:MAG TPA: gliding motility-associated ABC transporter ATP-binding subunit GldA [Bacteroidales bacterium]|nr:gliding motility-associated ABC transporter ATP-binding subunit GldA [Bacteroidales bacterium]
MDIIVENLTKAYGPHVAVNNISFTAKTGEVLGFLGPNGAGKTTTMKAITCFTAPNAGSITVGGISTKDRPEAVKQLIGYLPENNPLYLEMGVIDYLKFVGELYGIRKDRINSRVLEMIQLTGLQAEKHKKIAELSKGYRQRVGLAQALIHDPEVLILDEPTNGLDPNQIVEIRELIKSVGKHKTVILSSHILAEVEATCDRILIINKGRIVADSTPQELRKRSQGNEVLIAGISGGDVNTIFEKLSTLHTVAMVDIINAEKGLFEVQSHPETQSAKELFNLCAKNNWYLTQLTPVETKLEDVFRELTL